MSEHDKNYAAYAIDEQGGGLRQMEFIRGLVREFALGNEIVQMRTNPDTRNKVYIKNIL